MNLPVEIDIPAHLVDQVDEFADMASLSRSEAAAVLLGWGLEDADEQMSGGLDVTGAHEPEMRRAAYPPG